VGRIRGVEVWLTVALLGAFTVGAANAIPTNEYVFIDQRAFRDVHLRMQAGAGYYDAFRDAYAAMGIRIGEFRSYRQPWLFLAWRAVPDHLLQPLFFAVCVLGAGLAALLVAQRPLLALAPAVWLAVAGNHMNADGWLLSEVWTAPLVILACGAWLRGRHGATSAASTAAFLIREITAPLLLAFAFVQWRRGRPVRPYVVGIATSAVLYAAHVVVTLGYLNPPGNEAQTVGSGRMLSLGGMTAYGVALLPVAVGLAIWVVGLVRLWRSPLRPVVALALLPLAGVAIGRDYWGLTFMPLLSSLVLGVAEVPDAAGEATDDVSARAPSRALRWPRRQAATTVA
jgi:hypothetical protein